MSRLVLVDGSSFLFRAYYALPPLTSPSGMPTGAIYGVLNMLKKLKKDYAPDYMVVVFDGPGPTFRHQCSESYKANRTEMPEELVVQIEPLHRLIKAMGLLLIQASGVEADDVIATLVAHHRSEVKEIIISSGDKDFTPLVDEQVRLMDSLRAKEFDAQAVKEKFGVWPSQMLDWLCLVGDTSDNIPGIPGVGPKTAAKWLLAYENIENLLAHQEEIVGKVGEALRSHVERLHLNRELIALKQDVALPFSLNDLIPAERSADYASLAMELGFKGEVSSSPEETLDAVLLSNRQEWEQWLSAQHTPVMLHVLDGVCSAMVEKELVRCAFDLDEIWEGLLAIPGNYWVFDVKSHLKAYPFLEKVFSGDVQLLAYAQDTRLGGLSLKAILASFEYSFYGDARDVWACYAYLQGKLLETDRHCYHTIDWPLLEVLFAMESAGILVDLPYLKTLEENFGGELERLAQEIQEASPMPFNPASPKQLQEVLYEKLSLPVLEKTPKGQPSTAESVLQVLSAQHALPGLILSHRTLAKLLSTYVLPLQKTDADYRLHTTYHQAMTLTSRLSSSDPNLQNIPIRTAHGRAIRQAFIAPEDYVLLSADYSQIELRLMAHYSKDEKLCAAFEKGEDIHRATASEVWGKPLALVSDEERSAAKAINFGLIYGMSAHGLARQLGIERSSARDYITHYFERYPAVKTYMEQVQEGAARDGYVETWFKRRIYLTDIRSSHHVRRQAAARVAINAPLQGTAADLMKKAMIMVFDYLRVKRHRATLLLQIHDELVFEVHKDEVDVLCKAVKEIMENVVLLNVPLVVTAHWGRSWKEAH